MKFHVFFFVKLCWIHEISWNSWKKVSWNFVLKNLYPLNEQISCSIFLAWLKKVFVVPVYNLCTLFSEMCCLYANCSIASIKCSITVFASFSKFHVNWLNQTMKASHTVMNNMMVLYMYQSSNVMVYYGSIAISPCIWCTTITTR